MMTLIQDYGADLLRAIGLHTVYVLVSVVIGFAAGLVFGIIIPVLSIFQTIPGLVFIGVLFIWWGNIYPTVILALSVYAMFPVLKNTYTGILEVEPKYIEAAKGCGLSSFPASRPWCGWSCPWLCPSSSPASGWRPSTPSPGRCWPP